jgi:Tesmin/TSO1-like CXC domain, cysteine-rich domain
MHNTVTVSFVPLFFFSSLCLWQILPSTTKGPTTRAGVVVVAATPSNHRATIQHTDANVDDECADGGCRCKKGCLKLYCACLRDGARFCSPKCTCNGCNNAMGNPKRESAVRTLMVRYGDHAFASHARVLGCSCSGQCHQYYCVCKRLGRPCSLTTCNCKIDVQACDNCA